ncbi:hypothetical protein IVB12_15460 [Bradyrhizobium sp. 179]|uniref:hypothetical protein n=1 Tax=Bradyrhizobium sp. 179 TaxID=2782648 RepID=UPI001FF82D49|nr:hypothetical protein [Bradyrhizobium sp. 179]MCK1543312.1 hypothetical protein [Bradyrhizobium sp. 179]
MPKLPADQQTAILETYVGKIDKAMQALVRDSKKMADVLDPEAQTKLAAYLHARVNDMITDLGKAKRSVFSLAAPPIPSEIVLPGGGLPPALTIQAEKIIHGSLTGTLDNPPTPSVPQPQNDEDDELAAIAALDDEPAPPPPPKVAPLYEVAPEPKDPTKPPPKWRKPNGRLVGTKEPVWIETEPPRAAGDEVTEKPDATGFIKDAGFLEAE